MNATATGVQELTCQLLDAADGIPADIAAAGLIISHGHFLHRDAFRRTITASASISTGQPLAVIGWDAALHALEGGHLPCASSGKVTRYRLNRGGDRQANHALWRIVITRMRSDPATRAYVERRTKEGLSKREIIRCLKRYVAREVYHQLRGGA